MSFNEEKEFTQKELVHALRACATMGAECEQCEFYEADTPRGYNPCHESLLLTKAADFIESILSAEPNMTPNPKLLKAWNTTMSGYQKALDEISTPMQVIIPGTWNHSECPRCGESFIDYEDNDDGYITRARSMERCPYCGQKLDWTKDENNMY